MQHLQHCQTHNSSIKEPLRKTAAVKLDLKIRAECPAHRLVMFFEDPPLVL
jgi:hypothetical protein